MKSLPLTRCFHWLRRVRFALGLLALGFFLAVLLAFLFPVQVLTVDSGEVAGDVIVLMGGAAYERAERAAELFKQGAAPRILCTGFGDDQLNRDQLIKAGVPADAIVLESEALTTRENAQRSIPLLEAMGAKRVIIVTSWYHSRRALHSFEHYSSDIQFFSRPSYYGFPGKIEDGSSKMGDGSSKRIEWKYVKGYVRSEYLKLLGYWLRYGIWPV